MMKETKDGLIIEVRVKPNSKRFALTRKDDQLILEVTSPAKEGKANMEIIKGLKRLFGKDAEIVSGLRSRDKVILVRGANLSEVSSRLQSQSTL
jgi:uncharacterized protein (TIGR00251 family)